MIPVTQYPLDDPDRPASRPVASWNEVKIAIGKTHDRSSEDRNRRHRLREEVEFSRTSRRLRDILANALARVAGRP